MIDISSNFSDWSHNSGNIQEVPASAREFAEAVSNGLEGDRKSIPCQYLYDARGSALFEEICKQPEYYPTRTEAKILRRKAAEISEITGPLHIAELGSGTSAKTHHVLEAYLGHGDALRYTPVDVSEAAMEEAARSINRKWPGVKVDGIIGTYEEAFSLFPEISPLMVMFLGSTIGNFGDEELDPFLKKLANHLASEDFFLLGADLEKDQEILEAAYNDSAGITAEFTLNLFERMNRELDAGIDISAVEHDARYNPEEGQIEIHAHFLEKQEIYLAPLDKSVQIEAGEKVRTEISKKFRLDDLNGLLMRAGFEIREVFTDDREWFALILLNRRDSHG